MPYNGSAQKWWVDVYHGVYISVLSLSSVGMLPGNQGKPRNKCRNKELESDFNERTLVRVPKRRGYTRVGGWMVGGGGGMGGEGVWAGVMGGGG